MENNETRQNIKLGAFVLGGILLFIITLFYIGKENTVFNKTFTISAVFKNIEGLKEGDKVWLSGVKIGTVKHVQIISEGKVVVALSLRDKQNEFIKKNATAFIGSDGLVGNKIVVIRPGNVAQIIQDNDTINSFSPTDTQELINIAKDVGANTRDLTDDLKTITAKLKKGEGLVGELLQDGPISQDLRQAVVSLKNAGENTNRATEDLKHMLKEINSGDGLVTKLITDTTYAATFEKALANVAEVGKNSKQMSEDLKAVISKINSNDNAIGVLLADTAFANKLKVTLGNAESASLKLDQNMEALKHNFLLRGYFRKQKKAEEKAKEEQAKQNQPN
ncbi:MlaD family protein [Chryseolinea lacunae]|uniref:MCE family protein n=1 Tax=Chryseolinea lacunae TaxID=2801331 RepID=A0ABS1L0T6_9BACT|nr:MlaD family protein [Chryseolinea lacunae]MBL0745133.1 MCE family protein [Chryseolinea lacunae]